VAPATPVRRVPRSVVAPPTFFFNEGGWKVVSASVPGTSHGKSGLPCQDASHCKILAGRLLVGAVADGAGSSSYGDEGARIASRVAVETIAENVAHLSASLSVERWQRLQLAAMQAARGHIEASAAAIDAPVREFATTLLLFTAMPDMIVASQIGDGAIVFRESHGELRGLTAPQSGEYVNTTTFLVSPDAFKTVQHQVWRGPYSEIAAFTDGLQRLALSMPKAVPHAPFFAPLFDFVEKADSRRAIDELDAFLRSEKVTARADDDLTLFLARPTS
jgi:hypothetical protein